jgi:hypothetical protein
LLVLISIIFSVVVLNFHFRMPEKRRVPKWVHTYIIGKMGKLLGFKDEAGAFDINDITIGDFYLDEKREKQRDKLAKKNKNSKSKIEEKEEMMRQRSDENLKINAKFVLSKLQNCFNPIQVKDERIKVILLNEIKKCQENLMKKSRNLNEKDLFSLKISKSQSDHTKFIEKKIYDEWKILAMVVDRICFFVYLIFYVLISAMFLLSGNI